jgi:NitT/TauT family transport system permease protein
VSQGARKGAAKVAPPSALTLLSSRSVRTATSGLVGLLIWEIVARYVIHNALFLPTPWQVVLAGIELTQSGEIFKHIRASASHFLIGSMAGFVIGALIGMPMATSKTVFDYLDAWLSALYTTPLVALTPLFIIWFGIGTASKAVIVFLLVVFPVIINTMAGIRSVDRNLVDVATSFGASRREVLWKVMVPWAVPFILSGARIGVGRGVVGIFVAELFGGAGAGIGWLILTAGQVFNTPMLFVGVIVLALFGILVTGVLRWVERTVAPWRPEATI